MTLLITLTHGLYFTSPNLFFIFSVKALEEKKEETEKEAEEKEVETDRSWGEGTRFGYTSSLSLLLFFLSLHDFYFDFLSKGFDQERDNMLGFSSLSLSICNFLFWIWFLGLGFRTDWIWGETGLVIPLHYRSSFSFSLCMFLFFIFWVRVLVKKRITCWGSLHCLCLYVVFYFDFNFWV